MSDETTPLRRIDVGYQFVTLPLSTAYTNKNIGVRGRYLVVVQAPIEVFARINRTGGDQLPLHRISAISADIEDLYITTTTTSSDDLELLVFDDAKTVNVGMSATIALQTGAGVAYDARNIKEVEIWSEATQINNGATDEITDQSVSGYNKIVGWVFANQELTLTYRGALASGGTYRDLDSVTIPASTVTPVSFEVVSEVVELELDNSSGTNTTTCERWFAVSSGA